MYCIGEPQYLNRMLDLCVATALWLCYLVAPRASTTAGQTAAECVDWTQVDQLLSDDSVSSTRSDHSCAVFRYVPEFLLTNVFEIIKFLHQFKDEAFQV